MAAKLVARAHALEEGALHQIVGLAAALVLEEAIDALEVALEEILAGALVALAPSFEQGQVGVHGAAF